jgi:hypothetical protein
VNPLGATEDIAGDACVEDIFSLAVERLLGLRNVTFLDECFFSGHPMSDRGNVVNARFALSAGSGRSDNGSGGERTEGSFR